MLPAPAAINSLACETSMPAGRTGGSECGSLMRAQKFAISHRCAHRLQARQRIAIDGQAACDERRRDDRRVGRAIAGPQDGDCLVSSLSASLTTFSIAGTVGATSIGISTSTPSSCATTLRASSNRCFEPVKRRSEIGRIGYAGEIRHQVAQSVNGLRPDREPSRYRGSRQGRPSTPSGRPNRTARRRGCRAAICACAEASLTSYNSLQS